MGASENEKAEDFATLLAEYDKQDGSQKRRDPRVGDLVRGQVVSIGQEEVFVDLGTKAEAMIGIAELSDENGRVMVAVGDTVEARVSAIEGKAGCIVLRRVLGKGSEARAELESAFAHGIPVEGIVTAIIKGGAEIQLAGLRAFCPISQLSDRFVEDPGQMIGQRLTFVISRYEQNNRGDPNLVLSRRALLERETRERAIETRGRLAVGAVFDGKVTAIKDYGAFVDIGGIEGMVHVSELAFSRDVKPADVLSVGQTVTVQVLKIESPGVATAESARTRAPRGRPSNERIALSLKAMERDPWQDAPDRFPEGARVSGRVTRVVAFGAFVEIVPGVEGLLHISELGQERAIKHARELLKAGEPVEVIVLGIDPANRRLSLGLAPRAENEPLENVAAAHAPKSLGTLGDLLRGKRPSG
ncbi:MAG: S1 RNA-binding domain-containing protein [Pseudomonadota bacterium]